MFLKEELKKKKINITLIKYKMKYLYLAGRAKMIP